jgi:hypothetical protein
MRLLRSSLIAVGLTAVLAGTTLGAHVDQSQADSSATVTLLGAGELGQTFTAGRTGRLMAIRLWPKVDLAGSTVNVRAVVAGLPVDPVLASEPWGSHAVNQWVRVGFDDPARVAAGRQYAVSVQRDTSTSLGMTPGTDLYPGGALVFSGGSWSTISVYDLAFQTYVAKTVGAFEWLGVKDAPTWNRRGAGQTIHVRFSLGGDWGTKVIKGGWPRVRRVSCTTHKPIAGTDWQIRPFGGALAYADSTEAYTLSWKIPAAWGSGAMACRELRVQLIDGSTHSLFFRFREAA